MMADKPIISRTWEPIATAPRDGRILGVRGGVTDARPRDSGIDIVRWRGDRWVVYRDGVEQPYAAPVEWLKIVEGE